MDKNEFSMTATLKLENSVKFEENLFYERLLEMRRTNRKAFDSISPPSKLALLHYEKQKREQEQVQEMKR